MEADNSFKKEKLKQAKSEYQSALDIIPKQSYPISMINKIDSLLLVADNKFRLKAIDEAYEKAITEADRLYQKKKWISAKDKYISASEIKPGESYPKQRIATINGILSEIEKQSELKKNEEDYESQIIAADRLFREKEYENAKIRYNNALRIFPDREYPKQKIDEISEILTRLAEKERIIENDRKYKKFIIEADIDFKKRSYIDARNNYLSASHIKPDEIYPKKQIGLIKSILMEQKATAEEEARINSAYKNAIEIADFEFESQQYEASKEDYKRAIEIKPEESYPRSQIIKINELLRKSNLLDQINSTTEDAYSKAIERGDKALGFDELTVAKFYYNQAKELRPHEKYPRNKLNEVGRLWELRKKEKIHSEYLANIEHGDSHLKNEAYVAARFYYHKAGKLKPSEKLPEQKLKEVEEAVRLNKLNIIHNEYIQLIKDADDYLKEEDISVAEYYYEKALQLKGDEDYPVKKLNEIKEIKQKLKQEEKQSAYKKAIERADYFYGKEELTAARYFYYKALDYDSIAIHPQKKIEEIKAYFNPEFKARQKVYKNAITKADAAFEHKDYVLAKTWYNKALKIKDSDDYATDKINEITKIQGSPKVIRQH